jgi:DNA (cytosine-5)-methyltransferase 1
VIFGTVCSGIGAPEAAWKPLGWRCAFMSEIEPFPRAVLSHHYPEVPLHGDFTTIQAGDYADIDLLCGGTPCQSFSVAGLRGGMADERGNLALEYLRLADRLRPRWVVWENVPGVLSSNGGRDFGAFLGGLGELGYGFAYRSLDAQHFGLAQRRLRVFVVGYLGDWRPAAAVLFEPASLRGHPAPRREAGERVADCLTVGANQCSGGPADFVEVARCLTSHPSRSDGETETFVLELSNQGSGGNRGFAYPGEPTPTLDTSCHVGIAHTLRAAGFNASEDGTGRGVPLVPMAFGWQNSASQGDSLSRDTTPTLDKSKAPAVFGIDSEHNGRLEMMGTLQARAGTNNLRAAASIGAAVRRLTPRECERLQGFPDDFTLVPYRRGMAADGPRYKALGNSMAVPVMNWIGRRIAMVDAP